MTRKNRCALVGRVPNGLLASRMSCHGSMGVGDDCNVPMPDQVTTRLVVVFAMAAGPWVFCAAAGHAIRSKPITTANRSSSRFMVMALLVLTRVSRYPFAPIAQQRARLRNRQGANARMFLCFACRRACGPGAMRMQERLARRRLSIASGYAEPRNMVFPKITGRVALSCHDENTKSK